VVGQQNADIADTLQLRDVAMATIFVSVYMGCTFAPPGVYDWTVGVWQRCGLMSNYFDHLFLYLYLLTYLLPYFYFRLFFENRAALFPGWRS